MADPAPSELRPIAFVFLTGRRVHSLGAEEEVTDMWDVIRRLVTDPRVQALLVAAAAALVQKLTGDTETTTKTSR